MARIVENLPYKGMTIPNARCVVIIRSIAFRLPEHGGARVAEYRTAWERQETVPGVPRMEEIGLRWSLLTPEQQQATTFAAFTAEQTPSTVQDIYEGFGPVRYCEIVNGEDYTAQCYVHWVATDPAASPGTDEIA